MKVHSNRLGVVALVVLAGSLSLMGSPAVADSTTQPAASPVASSASPATQPAMPACDVYLVPFSSLGGDTSLDWAGKAVQQNLLTDLARANFQVVPAAKAIDNPADAWTAAAAVGAKYVLIGTYQQAGLLLRFNGQLLETSTGKVLGGLSTTGAPRDLFTMEDALSAQAIDQLTHSQLASGKHQAPLPPALQPAVVAQIIQPVAVAPAGSTSSYDGSALQQYVDANRTPSTDYAVQVQNADNRNTFGYGYNSFYNSSFGGYSYGLGYGGFGGFGYGLIYAVPLGGYHGGFDFGHIRNGFR